MPEKLIDHKLLRDFTENDSAMLADLVVIFCRAVPDYLARLEHSIDEADPAALCEVAHQMKSQFSYLFCDPLINLAMELEQLGHQGTTDGADSIAARLTGSIDQLLAELNQLTGLNLVIEED
jgi:HPt (histidine-containing phosphotransfer) domain-containing protein